MMSGGEKKVAHSGNATNGTKKQAQLGAFRIAVFGAEPKVGTTIICLCCFDVLSLLLYKKNSFWLILNTLFWNTTSTTIITTKRNSAWSTLYQTLVSKKSKTSNTKRWR